MDETEDTTEETSSIQDPIVRKYIEDLVRERDQAFGQAAENEAIANLGRAGSTISSAIVGGFGGNAPVDQSGWDSLQKSARMPIDKYNAAKEDRALVAKYLVKKNPTLKSLGYDLKTGEAMFGDPADPSTWKKVPGVGKPTEGQPGTYSWAPQGVTGPDGMPVVLNTKTGTTGSLSKTGGVTVGSAISPPKKFHELPYQEKLEKLEAGKLKDLNFTSEALVAVKDMNAAVQAGVLPEMKNSLGVANDYSVALDKFTEAVGRLKSGGVIGPEEAKTFKRSAPTLLDFKTNPALALKKLSGLEDDLKARIGTLGFRPEELPAVASWKPNVVGSGKGGSGTALGAPRPTPTPLPDNEVIVRGPGGTKRIPRSKLSEVQAWGYSEVK